ncbi:hypothetical protein BT96DRAFT_1001258 [Gymnopus androsaceus JB14]|uniref:Uncharacterized protein n=1 Tax=Gymnopus androsaceus JB14 TaxID=1447944 RepID=A0A6A4H296_9AGAR|nr:hypothetical protein BT96DRAFT_1001258 [Gymnopus androsaceus JB14]
MPASLFDVYITSLHSTRYSSGFFTDLTFANAASLNMPKELPEGSITNWVFTSDTPDEDCARYITPIDAVPAASDLCPIMNKLKEEYNSASCSVSLTIKTCDQVQNVMLHFAKLRLYTAINNNREAVALSAGYCVTSAALGFYTADFPLWKLGTLLAENYVDEDIMSGFTELLYFRSAVSSPFEDPTHLFLPTFFMNNAFNHNCHLTGSNVKALQDHISALPFTIRTISFLACIDRHYTAYFYNQISFQYGDTLGGGQTTATETALKAFQQLIEGINLPQTTSLVQGNVLLQGPHSGSCRIGGLAWIEKQNDSSVPVWTNEMSGVFRDCYLSDLLIFDMISRNSQNPQNSWFTPCLACPCTTAHNPQSIKMSDQLDVGFNINYEDYKIVAPTVLHPIYEFSTTHEALGK